MGIIKKVSLKKVYEPYFQLKTKTLNLKGVFTTLAAAFNTQTHGTRFPSYEIDLV